jgi:DNA ligase 1
MWAALTRVRVPPGVNQSLSIDRRSCKHIRQYRGESAEQVRLGMSPTITVTKPIRPKAPALLLAHTWEDRVNPSGWWLSEKLDGVRAYWDGNGQFLSRQGNRFFAPQ